MSILSNQARIIAEFEEIGDWEDRYKLIIDTGRELPELADEHKTDDNKVRGCSSTIWLVAHRVEDGTVDLRGRLRRGSSS